MVKGMTYVIVEVLYRDNVTGVCGCRGTAGQDTDQQVLLDAEVTRVESDPSQPTWRIWIDVPRQRIRNWDVSIRQNASE